MKNRLLLILLLGFPVALILMLRPKTEKPAESHPSTTTQFYAAPESQNIMDDTPVPVPATAEQDLNQFRQEYARSTAEQLNVELNAMMSAKGFTQDEIDLMGRNLTDAFLNRKDSINLAGAVDSTCTTLNISGSRRHDMNNAVLNAVGRAMSAYAMSDYQTCVTLRTAPASSCVKDLAQDLLQKVSARSDGDRVDGKTVDSLDAEEKEALRKAAEVCGEDPELAKKYLSVGMIGCV